MVRLNSVDPRNPTLGPGAVRVAGMQIRESDGSVAGVYRKDFQIPAYGVLLDVWVHNEELWTAASSATLDVGTFLDASGAISTEIDADGIFAAISLKATDLTKGQALAFARVGGKGGAQLTEGSSSHYLNLVKDDPFWVSAVVTTVGTVGTAGETYVYVMYAVPEMDPATFTASA